MTQGSTTTGNIFIPALGGQGQDMLCLCRKNGGGQIPVLFLHGSTIPASLAFCTSFGGKSYLDLYSDAGLDAWSLDFRGFGRSYRPESTGGPVTFTEDAVSDVSATADHILAVTGSSQLDIVGWSWGSTVAASFAAQERTRLRRLTLLAPQWLRDTPSPLLANPDVLEQAYRTVAPQALVSRWIDSLPEGQAQVIRDLGWADMFKTALENQDNRADTAPNGPLVEIARNWSNGLPIYDPRKVRVPVRLIVGSSDPETRPEIVRSLFTQFADHPDAQLLEIAGATHFAPLEPKREAIAAFVTAYLTS